MNLSYVCKSTSNGFMKKILLTIDGEQVYPFKNGGFINVKPWLHLDKCRMSKGDRMGAKFMSHE